MSDTSTASPRKRLIAEIRSRPIGERLPSSRDLAEQLGLGVKAVQGLLHELQADGLVELKPRAAARVINHTPPSALGFGRNSEHIHGVRPTLVTGTIGPVRGDERSPLLDRARERLDLPPDGVMMLVERLRAVEEQGLKWDRAFVKLEVFRLEDLAVLPSLEDWSLMDYYRKVGYEAVRRPFTVTAIAAAAEHCAMLDRGDGPVVEPGMPLLRITQTSYCLQGSGRKQRLVPYEYLESVLSTGFELEFVR